LVTRIRHRRRHLARQFVRTGCPG